MMLLTAVASFSFVFGWVVLLGWDGSLYARAALAGTYFLIATVAGSASAVLFALERVLLRLEQRGPP